LNRAAFQRCITCVERALADAKLHVDDIDSLCPMIDAKLLELGERGAPPSLVREVARNQGHPMGAGARPKRRGTY